MDKATATKYHFKVGDRVRVLLAGPPQTFTITGIVTFGTADNLAGATLAAFDLPTAQALFDTPRVLRHDRRPGQARGRQRPACSGRSPGSSRRACRWSAARPSPTSCPARSATRCRSSRRLLLVFALISLFVGAFTIFNTFSITVGQRTRELALLRVVGASRRQVFRSVLGEAALVGLVASLIGLGLGVLAALGLKALLGAFGVTLPSAPLVFEPRTAVVALAVGVGVTVVSAIGPARRAVRIPPVAALVESREDEGESLRPTGELSAAAVAVGGIAALVAGLAAPRDRAGRARRGGHVRRCRHAGADRGPADVGAARATAGRPARDPGKAGTGELDAQPAADRPDRGRPDGRPGAGVGDRRARRLAVQVGDEQRRQRHHRRLHHHRPEFGVQHLGGPPPSPGSRAWRRSRRLPGPVRAPGARCRA